MTDLQAIEKRVSRRSYLNGAIEEKKVNVLKSFIHEINKEGDLSVDFIGNAGRAFNGITKSYGMFSGVSSLIVLKGRLNDMHLEEKAGYFGERLVLEAIKLGLGTCWVAGTFDKKYIERVMPRSEKIVCVITVGNAAEDKTAKERFIGKFTHLKTKGIENLFFSKEPAPDWFIYGIRAVLKAPSALNRQKVFFEYQNKKAVAYIDDKYELGHVDLGIAKLHFEIGAGGRFSLGNPGVFTKN